MAIDSNVLLKAIVPDAVGSASRGFQLGQTIRNAPLVRQLNEQKATQGQQAIETTGMDMGQTISKAAYSLVGETPVTADNYLTVVNQLKRANIPFEADDFEVTEENISGLQGLVTQGKNLAQSQRGGLASAKTTQYGNGTAIFALPDGTVKVVDPTNKEVTDPEERVKVINAAKESGITQAGQEAFTRASESAKGGATGASEVIDKTVSNLSAEEQAKVRSQNQEKRAQDTISAGLSAAPQYNDVSKGLELIDEVSQGGLAVRAKKVTDFFGTTSQNVGDLNRTLASTVLQGLAAFTGAISEGERDFVESMSASLSQGKEVNRGQLQRLKSIYTGQIKKAALIAKRNEDFQTLDSLRVDLGDSDLGRELFPKSFKKKDQSTNNSNIEDLGDGFSVEFNQ